MAYKFKIVKIDEFNAVMQVNYYCDELPEGMTIGVDIIAGKTKEETIKHIEDYTPYNALDRAILLKNGVDTSHIEDLLHIEHEVSEKKKEMSENETLKLIEELLKDTK
jgi:hypothetical protein